MAATSAPDVVAVQAVQADLLDRVPALQAEQQVAAGEATAEVVRPVGADQQEARAGQLGQAVDDRRALGVGPVQVLEDDDGRLVADALGEAGHDRVRVGEAGRRARRGPAAASE